MGKLTAQEAKNIKPGSKQQKLSDGEGMYLLVTKTGKYWRYDYRYLKKRKTLALGRISSFCCPKETTEWE